MSDPDIEALGLADTAKAAAYKLRQKHPEVVFTSGRRNLAGQAAAMAGNVALKRSYIVDTYAPSQARAACQAWVDAHPEAITPDAIAAGLLGVLTGLGDAAGAISKHLTGEAFDVQPVTKNAAAIIAAIEQLPGKTLFLRQEGGLTRWHVQF